MSDGFADDVANEDLAYGGICPVCGKEFIDGFGPLEENFSYDAQICVVEKNEESKDGTMLVHLKDVDVDDEWCGNCGQAKNRHPIRRDDDGVACQRFVAPGGESA